VDEDICTPRTNSTPSSTPRPTAPTSAPSQPRPRRHVEPRALAQGAGEQSKSAPSRAAPPNAAPKRLRSHVHPKVEGGGLLFLPTDGVPAVGRCAEAGTIAAPFLSSAEMFSRGQWSRASSSASCTEPSTEVPPSEDASYLETDDMDLQQAHWEQQAAAAGSSLHSARLLRDRGGQRNSPPPWPEEPQGPTSHRRPPKVPAAANFKSTVDKLPLLSLRSGSPARVGRGAPSAPCVLGCDSRGTSPYDDDEDGMWAECRSLPAKLTPTGHESAWPDGMLHFRSNSPGNRVPRKLAPLPF